MSIVGKLWGAARSAWRSLAPVHRHVALVNASRIDDASMAFYAKALNLQLERDIRKHWPDVGRWTCAVYRPGEHIKAEAHVMLVMESGGGDDGTLAVHYIDGHEIGGRVYRDRSERAFGPAGVSWAASHELEMAINPRIDAWVLRSDGWSYAKEIADPVQYTSYAVDVTIGRETRTVRLSNFVTPAWFVEGSKGPWDFAGVCSGPFDVTHGYAIRERGGERNYVYGEFGRGPDLGLGSLRGDRWGRGARMLRGEK